jgi:hypothetical protein
MTPAQVKAAILAAIIALSAGGAWYVRGLIAHKQVTALEAKNEAEHKKALQDALDNAEASQRAAAESEARRLAEQGKERIVYRDIEKEVVRYVETHSSPDGCGLTDDGLRLWRAARDAQPVDSGEPAK